MQSATADCRLRKRASEWPVTSIDMHKPIDRSSNSSAVLVFRTQKPVYDRGIEKRFERKSAKIIGFTAVKRQIDAIFSENVVIHGKYRPLAFVLRRENQETSAISDEQCREIEFLNFNAIEKTIKKIVLIY